VRGAVRDPSGEGVPEALVVVYRMLDDEPVPDPAAHDKTGVDGAFRLDVAEPGPYLVAVLAAGYRPAGATVAVSVGEVVAIDAVRLEPGDEIRGRVTRRGGLAGAGAEVRAERAGLGTSLPVPGRRDRLIWTPERLVHGDVTAVADAEGRYVIGGLDPVEHRVRVVRRAPRSRARSGSSRAGACASPCARRTDAATRARSRAAPARRSRSGSRSTPRTA